MPTILNTRVIIAKNIKMDREYKHVLNYNENEILSLLTNSENLVNQTYRASFVNETGRIRVPFTFDECIGANYIAFQNPTYSNKWFFAFIDKVTFLAKNTQEIEYTSDIWSTWFSYLTIKPSFVVREHTNNDTIGVNRIEENIDVGVIQDFDIFETFGIEFPFYIGIASTHRPWDLEEGVPADFTGVACYNKQIYGHEIHLIQITSNENSLTALIAYLYKTSQQVTDIRTAIQDIFIIPYELITASELIQHTLTQGSTTYNIYTLPYSLESKSYEFNQITKFYNWSDYTPKNNKCYQYPFNYLYATNNQGNNNIYKYEDFLTENPVFKIVEAIGVGNSVIAYPKYYKGAEENLDEAIPLGKYPVCGWASDSYVNWLTQNSVNTPLKLVSSGENVANYSMKMNAGEYLAKEPMTQMASASLGMNLGNNILSIIGDFKMASLLPNVSQGGNTGNVHFANNTNNFRFIQKRSNLESIKIVDDYFTMYGYKTNKIKIPNITGRRNFNFIEISPNDCLGYGSIPSMAMDTINKVARRGVTIWHNHANFGNYNVDNSII